MSMLKKIKNLQVFIVEQHNDVVPYLHRAIGSRLLPYSDIPVIHLDSHPDLLLPVHMQAEMVYQPQVLYQSLSIENWLLPLAYAKHINHIVWVKPPWCKQIQTPEQTFTIGKSTPSGNVRLDCKENYFMTEGLYCPKKDLLEASNITLTVVELRPDNWTHLASQCDVHSGKNTDMLTPNNSVINRESLIAQLQDIVGRKPYVLDVDLDFFSTANPFRTMLTKAEEEAVRRLYQYDAPVDLSDESIEIFTHKRETQLNQLEAVFSTLETRWLTAESVGSEQELENFSLADFVQKDGIDLVNFSCQQQADLLLLCRSVLQHKQERETTFMSLHYFGCTLDDTELPHHISTPEQVAALMGSFRGMMEQLPRPAVVTIARSSEDGYCPADSVDQFQVSVLQILEDLFGPLEKHTNYELDV